MTGQIDESVSCIVIDSHVHLYPDAIAGKVVGPLAARFGNPPAFDGTVAGCIEHAVACSIAASVNLPVATKAESVRHTNTFWSAYAPGAGGGAARSRVVSMACFHPGVARKGEEVEWIAKAGFTGIKLHPEYQHFRFNDAAMDEAWAALEEFGLVAYLHAGGERVFEPPYNSSPAEIALLQRRFPRLRIIAAHLGGFHMWDEVERELAGTSVNLDLSHTFFWMDAEQILRIIKRHGASRILFGSDAPWQDPGKVLEAFMALGLSDGERAAILGANAMRELGIRL